MDYIPDHIAARLVHGGKVGTVNRDRVTATDNSHIANPDVAREEAAVIIGSGQIYDLRVRQWAGQGDDRLALLRRPGVENGIISGGQVYLLYYWAGYQMSANRDVVPRSFGSR